MAERTYFTRAEAEAKVGKRVKTLVDFSGVPKGTTGQVIRADPAGKEKPPFGEAREVFDVAIQWDVPREYPSAKPLVDWFSRDEYEQFLVERDNG
jgi:hypothetical protein